MDQTGGKAKAEQSVSLMKRQILGEEAASWHSIFRIVGYQPGENYWVAITTDAQGEGPVFRISAAKKTRELVTPEMLAERVREELASGAGRVEVVELEDGIPVFQAVFELGFTFSTAQRICLFTTDPERQPLTPTPSEEEGASEAEVEARLSEANEARAAFEAARE